MVVEQKIDTDVVVLDYDCLSPSIISKINSLKVFVVVVNNNLLQGSERRLAFDDSARGKGTTPAPDTSNAEHTAHKKISSDLLEKIPNLCGYVVGDTSNFTIVYIPNTSMLSCNKKEYPNLLPQAHVVYPICTNRDGNFYPIDREPRDLPNKPRGYAVQHIFWRGSDKKGSDKKYKCVSDSPVFQQWAKNMKWQFSNTADIIE